MPASSSSRRPLVEETGGSGFKLQTLDSELSSTRYRPASACRTIVFVTVTFGRVNFH
jgi:hypothetical protein